MFLQGPSGQSWVPWEGPGPVLLRCEHHQLLPCTAGTRLSSLCGCLASPKCPSFYLFFIFISQRKLFGTRKRDSMTSSQPQGTVLPESLALTILTSVLPGHLTLTSSLRADEQDLLLELSQSSRPRHVSGSLSHSFPWLRRTGVAQVVTMEATAPGGREQPGLLFVRAGTCFIRASRFTETRGGEWLWALQSNCPALQVLQLSNTP